MPGLTKFIYGFLFNFCLFLRLRLLVIYLPNMKSLMKNFGEKSLLLEYSPLFPLHTLRHYY